MTATSTPEARSERSSYSPSLDAEEPRKKGSRGGKRSVSHLSKAQLARKRANDREAQRNIRQRTKEHIETLERKVKELEAGGRSSSMERVLRRNRELECELEQLRAQLSSTSSTPSQLPSELSDDLFTQPKRELDWLPEPSLPWASQIPPHMSAMNSNPEVSGTMALAAPAYATTLPGYPPRSTSNYIQDAYSSNNMQVWPDASAYGSSVSQVVPKPTSAAASYSPAYHHAARYSDYSHLGFNEMHRSTSAPREEHPRYGE